MKTTFAVCSAVGTVRRTNQDNFYLNGVTKPVQLADISLKDSSEEPHQVFALCDGMGGESSGELAASLAVETLKSYPHERFGEQWQDYITEANRRVCDFQREHRIRMGTTYTGLFFADGKARAVNVGDSRAYLIRDGKITQLSRDHTEFQVMVEAGLLRAEDFSESSAHNHLTQNIGIEPEEMELEPSATEPEPVQDGDLYLLCSDGLYGVVPDAELLRVAEETPEPAECCKKFIELAEKQGSKDNITALLIRVSLEKLPDAPEAAPKKSGKWKKRLLLLAAVAAVLGACAGYYLWDHPVVPEVTGEAQASAEAALEEQGFQASVTTEYSDETEEGAVLSQEPEGGSRGRRGDSVSLVVSLGVEPVSVPDVVGKAEEAALSAMEEAGLTPDIQREYSDDVAEGCAISQTPPAGSSVSPGTTVTVRVSRGPETAEVPNLVGMTEAEAEQALAALELETETTEEYSAVYEAGTVIRQTPEAGEKLARGKSVQLVLSKGPEMVTVPDLTGLSWQEAQTRAEEAGFSVALSADSAADGTVSEQTPAAGTSLEKGGTITCTLEQARKWPLGSVAR